MRRLAAVAALAGTLFASSSALAAACLTEAEFEAEQAIRLHTELMVVGLTCQQATPAGQPSLFARYREFTDRHQAAVRSWEAALIGHYRRAAKGNASRAFDSFRTSLANETSRRAIALTNPVFCATYVPAAEQVLSMTADQLRQRLAQVNLVRVSAVPRCEARPAGMLVADRPTGQGAGNASEAIVPAR